MRILHLVWWLIRCLSWGVGCFWFFARRYLRNNAVALDQLGSTLTGGDEDDTISSRLGKTQRGDHGLFWLVVFFVPRLIVDLLLWPFDGWQHCLNSIENDRGNRAVFAVSYPKAFPKITKNEFAQFPE